MISSTGTKKRSIHDISPSPSGATGVLNAPLVSANPNLYNSNAATGNNGTAASYSTINATASSVLPSSSAFPAYPQSTNYNYQAASAAPLSSSPPPKKMKLDQVGGQPFTAAVNYASTTVNSTTPYTPLTGTGPSLLSSASGPYNTTYTNLSTIPAAGGAANFLGASSTSASLISTTSTTPLPNSQFNSAYPMPKYMYAPNGPNTTGAANTSTLTINTAQASRAQSPTFTTPYPYASPQPSPHGSPQTSPYPTTHINPAQGPLVLSNMPLINSSTSLAAPLLPVEGNKTVGVVLPPLEAPSALPPSPLSFVTAAEKIRHREQVKEDAEEFKKKAMAELEFLKEMGPSGSYLFMNQPITHALPAAVKDITDVVPEQTLYHLHDSKMKQGLPGKMIRSTVVNGFGDVCKDIKKLKYYDLARMARSNLKPEEPSLEQLEKRKAEITKAIKEFQANAGRLLSKGDEPPRNKTHWDYLLQVCMCVYDRRMIDSRV